MPETAERVAAVLEKHLPVIVGHAHAAGCSCGADPLDLTEHVARKVADELDEPAMHLHLAIDTAEKAEMLRGWLDEHWPPDGAGETRAGR